MVSPAVVLVALVAVPVVGRFNPESVNRKFEFRAYDFFSRSSFLIFKVQGVVLTDFYR